MDTNTKKLFKIVISCSLILLLLSSCISEQTGNKEIEKFFPVYKTHVRNKELEKELIDNPIDRSFTQEIEPNNTADLVDFYGKYISYWQIEMDNAILTLRNKLSGDTFIKFLSTQNDWENLRYNDLRLFELIHTEAEGDGSGIALLLAIQDLDKVRTRALELIEYCSYFVEYEFVFKSK